LLLSQGGAIDLLGENFISSSCKWAVIDFANKITPAELSDTIVCKETLQLPFTHIENLISLASDDP